MLNPARERGPNSVPACGPERSCLDEGRDGRWGRSTAIEESVTSAVAALTHLQKMGDLCLSCASAAVAKLAIALIRSRSQTGPTTGSDEFLAGMNIARIVSEGTCSTHKDRRVRRDGAGCIRTTKSLSVREREILGLIADGKSNKEIAHVLNIGAETVKTHIRNIFWKLGVEKRAQAVARGCFELRL